MTPIEKAKITRRRNAAIKERALRKWHKDRLSDLTRRLAAFTDIGKLGVRKLTAIKRMAADERCDANVRAIALTMAKKFQHEAAETIATAKTTAAEATREPKRDWGVPSTLEEWDALRKRPRR
jgi:hypothetical protein